MRVFLDANVLFSAAKTDGAVRALLAMALDRGHELHVDAFVIAEAQRNLDAKGRESLDAFEVLKSTLRVAAFVPVDSRVAAWVGWLPEKDQPVLAAAIRLRCHALVTGDRKHFGAGYGKVFGGVLIHSPRSLAEQLMGRV